MIEVTKKQILSKCIKIAGWVKAAMKFKAVDLEERSHDRQTRSV